MKKILITLLIVFTITSSNCMYVNAGHQHTDKCYETQGAHTHSGDSTSGGACYGTPVYHNHIGDSTSGGACYGTPVYHAHTGTAGKTTPNGCYNKAKATTQQVTCTDSIKIENTKHENHTCPNCGPQYFMVSSYHWHCPNEGFGRWTGELEQCQKCGWIDQSGSTSGTNTHTISKNVTIYELGCGKSTNTIEKYNLSCTKSTTNAESYNLSCTKTAETIDSYDLSCTKTAETIDSYDLSCTKTAETLEGYKLSCTKKESGGTRVLICTQQESSDNPTPTPNIPVQVPNVPSTPKQEVVTPDPEQKEPVKEVVKEEVKEPVKEVVKEEVKEPVKEVVEDIFDFRVECDLISDGALVKIIPLSMDNLADVPYSWDNGMSWNKSDESVFAKNGTYYIAIKNKEGNIKAKKLDIDFEITNFAVITDYAATLSEVEFKEMIKTEEEPVMEVIEDIKEDKPTEKKSGGKIALAIGAITIFVGGIGFAGFFLVKKLLLGSGGIIGGGTGGAAKVIDSASGKTLGKCQIKKRNGEIVSFETKINDKAIIFVEDGFTIVPPKKMVNKYIGHNLIVKTSQGNFEAVIAETIDIDF